MLHLSLRPSRLAFALLLAAAVGGACSPQVTLPPASTSPPGTAEPAPEPAASSEAPSAEGAPGAEAAAPGQAAQAAQAAGEAGAAGTPADRPEEPRGPRAGSVGHISWIWSEPSKKSRPVGYIREGTSIALASADKVKGAGCPGGWYAARPHGFVCVDQVTTLDLDGPVFRGLAASAPRNGAVSPYRYAFSDEAPMYTRIPSPDEQRKVEGPADKRAPVKLGSWASSHQELAQREAIAATDEAPGFLKEAGPSARWGKALVRKWIPAGSMLAYSHAFEAEGRVWLLSPDMTLVPADRVRPFRRSTFHGAWLDREGSPRLPLAWSRHDAVTRYRKGEGGFVPEVEKLAPRSFVGLTDERVEEGKRVFLGTTEPGVFVLEADVAVARVRDKLPALLGEGEKWIDVHLRSGTLVAYVGMKPVFATLVSPGAGGVGPYKATNAELVKLSATPLGVYRMNWKTRAAAMSPEEGEPTKFWIADVPHTQYFRAPFALHTAYWHEDFGMPKSAGCVNVSPEDGAALFGWTDPPVPDGWQGAAPSKETGPGTAIVISP